MISRSTWAWRRPAESATVNEKGMELKPPGTDRTLARLGCARRPVQEGG